MIEIHGVVQGPHIPPDFYGPIVGSGDDDNYLMIVIAVVDNEVIYDFELSSNDFNWLYEVQKWCDSRIEPFIIKEEGEQDDKD